MTVRVLIYGAGIIGQVYAGRLEHAGHDVTLLARGDTAASLAKQGIVLRKDGGLLQARPPVVTAVPDGAEFDVILVCVRGDQLAAILPALAAAPARQVVFMLNQCNGLERIREQVGADRTLYGFPGVAGRRTRDGFIEYLELPQQHTTIELRGGSEQPVVDLLRGAGFIVDVSRDMDGWLTTHAVFLTTVGAAILGAGGDSVALAADRARVTSMVAAVGEGFRALRRRGVTVTPLPLRIIFTVVPRSFAVRYWRKQLSGLLGTVAIAPHMRATRDTELAWLVGEVRQLVAGHGPAPQLDRLLSNIKVE
jgi:2-dehydropantoate 2-reductase